MRMATVTRKKIPMIRAVVFSFLWSSNRVAFPSYAVSNCAVISSIVAVVASQRLMFQKSSGICILWVVHYFVLDYCGFVRRQIIVFYSDWFSCCFSQDAC